MVCRQQLSLDVRLERGGGAPWGFQLVGGAEADCIEPRVPLTVTQVEPDTPASRAGLADGDVLVAINGARAHTLTREAAHDIIVGCKLRIHLAVIRTIGSPEQEDISSSDIPCEVPPPPHARSATSSPFMPHIKPFRPFSTEPLDAVPPLERPIILSPFYHDNFTKLKKLDDFEPPTKFKLEISKDYIPDDEMSVTESYSKVQVEQLTSMEELSTELDIQQIEDTAAIVLDESVSKAVSVTDNRIENYKSKEEINEIIDKTDSRKVSVSLLTQLIDQTADEISKSKLNELTEKKETNVEVIENIESVEFAKFESNISEENSLHEIKLEKSIEIREDIEKHNLERSEKQVLKNIDMNESHTESTFIEEESKSAKDIIKSINSKVEENAQDIEISKKHNAEKKVAVHTETSRSKGKVTENKQNVESRSLNEVKHQTISTANLLAEQRAYTLGLQTIPNIQGRVQSTYHYDLLLKTFFIHLTDVMVALSRIILSDGASRSVSPMPPQKTEDAKHETEQVTTNKSVHEHTITHNEAVEESHVNNDSKKISATKFAQRAQLKTDEITQKMDAVISEFKKVEEVQTQDSIDVSHSVRGKSISKIEEQVLQENDPLDWLSKVDENKTNVCRVERRESKTSELDDENSNSKIIYIATVEAHQIANLDTSLIETNMAENVFAETESVLISDKSEEAIKIKECTSELVEKKNQSLESLITEDCTESTLEQSLIQESQVSISEQTQSFALEESKIESVAQKISIEESKLECFQASETTAVTRESVSEVSINSESIEVIAAVSPQRSRPESRKTSIEDGEPVRKPDLESQSDDSYVPAPQTPLTDEYIFRLQLPLEESKNPLPLSPPVEHEDPYTVKKPKLIPHIETALHTPKLFEDPEKAKIFTYPNEQLPNTNGTAFPGSTEKVDDISKSKDITAQSNEPNAVPGTILPRLSKVVDPGTDVESSLTAQSLSVTDSNVASVASNVETKSLTNIETTTTHGARRTSTSYVEESLVQISEERNKSVNEQVVTETLSNISRQKAGLQQNIASMSNGIEHYVKQNCGLVSKDYGVETHHGGLVKTDQAMAPIAVLNTKQASSNIKDNFNLVCNNYGSEAHNVGLVKKGSVSASIPNVNTKQVGYVKQNCGLISTNYGVETHHGGLVKKVQVAPMPDVEEKQASYIKQNCGLVNKHYGVVTHHGGVVKRIQDGGAEQHGAIANGVDGTTLGIVDSLDNAGILDEEVAKQLGKPGLTEEKIAELISGESEMLREAHVIGLKRVLASHMSRLNDDDDSVDFKKLKPQIDALRDSEVLKALNEELVRTKQEKLKEERKWTTFLQRPQRVVPKSKYGTEPEMPKECYKINIVKQPKPRVAPDYKPQDFETGPLPWEARAANQPPAPPVPREEPILVPEEGPEYLEALDNLPESEVPDLEDTGIPLPPEPIESPQPASPPPSPEDLAQESERDCAEAEPAGTDAEPTEANDSEDMERNQLAEKIMGSIQSMVDPCASVDEQLKQMRLQLAALAQLPGVITQTLELVTEQLGQLTEPKDEGNCGVTVTELPEETPTTDEQQDIDAARLESSEPVSAVEVPNAEPSLRALEQVGEQQVSLGEQQVRLSEQQDSLSEQEVRLSEQRDSLSEQQVGLSEQHKIDIQKREVISELQLEHEARQVKQRPPRVASARPKPAFGPLTPQERPLVLPGGRRWRNAKDAYNEDFIRETLASQAEIIQGKAKGVNFMKWEKPAKTLDHLKDSDVYKLIHNMDADTGKQVDHLPPRVMAESEYREQSRNREILDNGVSVTQQSRPASAYSQELIPQVFGRCSPVCAAKCLQACFTECPQACGGVLPDVCDSKCQNGGMTAQKQDGVRMTVKQDGRVSAPIVTELIVPPAPLRVELPPRPSSVAEAVEIVTNYVEVYEHKSRTTPAA